jgi:predicted RNA-binding Zn-ribbon protein involved in translation (DUF1610 family)
MPDLPVKLTTKGRCTACGGEYNKAGMTRHLSSCPALEAQQKLPAVSARQKTEQGKLFHLIIEGHYAPIYWLHLEVPAVTTLLDLDKFLRDFWLECCGHLSAFEISGQRYTVYIDPEFDMGEKSMRGVKLERVLEKGVGFNYEYDFGTTTHLDLRVLGVREGVFTGKGNKSFRILAQNDAPQIPCDKCGKIGAVKVCTECRWHGEAWWCEECAASHEEHEDYFLPVVNSPRVGECGYVG